MQKCTARMLGLGFEGTGEFKEYDMVTFAF